mmetsp:Transcript_8991/g.16687  ORF Transcript_8991/g.16687 Transcript_8991/m.16687 type:complete len:379 (+) Transcript_8991:1536-2672(+)
MVVLAGPAGPRQPLRRGTVQDLRRDRHVLHLRRHPVRDVLRPHGSGSAGDQPRPAGRRRHLRYHQARPRHRPFRRRGRHTRRAGGDRGAFGPVLHVPHPTPDAPLQGRSAHGREGDERRHCRSVGERQVDHREASAQVLRPHRRSREDRRHPVAGSEFGVVEESGRIRRAGTRDVPRNNPRKHRVRQVERQGGLPRGDRERGHRGRQGRLLPRLHQGTSRRIRHLLLGGVHPAVGRADAAHLHRAGHDPQPDRPAPRRGDVRARYQLGAAGANGRGQHPGAQVHHDSDHRPPAVDDCEQRSDRRHRRGRRGGAGNAQGAHRAGRHLHGPVRESGHHCRVDVRGQRVAAAIAAGREHQVLRSSVAQGVCVHRGGRNGGR